MSLTERKCENLVKLADSANFLPEAEKKIRYYLTNEDFANERFAMIELVEIILRFAFLLQEVSE